MIADPNRKTHPKGTLQEVNSDEIGFRLPYDDIELNLSKEVRSFNNLHKKNVDVKHHINVFQFGTAGDILKFYVNDGSLKTNSLRGTLDNSRKAYEENPNLFPETYKVGEGRLKTNENQYDLLVLQQDFISEAENGTLKDHLKDGWDHKAVAKVLDKLDQLKDSYRINASNVKVETLEGFLNHEGEYNKRWNAPIGPYCLGELKESGEDYLEGIETENWTKNQTLTKVTREFAPRNAIVEGNKLTFDTELYGIGSPNIEHGTMISQLIKGGEMKFAKRYMDQIDQRYCEGKAEEALEELISYRAGEVLKEKIGIGDERYEYHADQLKQTCNLLREY